MTAFNLPSVDCPPRDWNYWLLFNDTPRFGTSHGSSIPSLGQSSHRLTPFHFEMNPFRVSISHTTLGWRTHQTLGMSFHNQTLAEWYKIFQWAITLDDRTWIVCRLIHYIVSVLDSLRKVRLIATSGPRAITQGYDCQNTLLKLCPYAEMVLNILVKFSDLVRASLTARIDFMYF